MIVRSKDLKTLLKAQQGELDAVLMYNALSKVAKDPADAAVFKQLAAEEGGHAAVFYRFTERKILPNPAKAIALPIMYKTLGRKKLYPIIAKGEYDAVKKYEAIADYYPEVAAIKDDEQRHGDTVLGLLK